MNWRERQFWKFHKDNPHVYQLFDQFTRQVLATGARRYSAYAIINRIRWHTAIETVGTEFKISNDIIPYLCRYWLQRNPEHANFFVTHELKGEGWIGHPPAEAEEIAVCAS